MAEPSTPSRRHRISGFLSSHRRRRDKSSHVADAARSSASASITSSVTSEPPESPTPSAFAMEGPLKKRLAKMPVMHDRYCVATWELDAADRKCVMLRSYKSRRAYDAHPEKPSSVHQLKCISDWDGRTGFHRYQHAFTMETPDRKLFQCVAPSAADKDKWLELMAVQSAFQSGRDMRLGSAGSLVPLRRTQSIESAVEDAAGKPRGESDVHADHSTDSEDQGRFPGHDGLFRTESGASSNSLELPSGDKSEPADWGLYGEAGGDAPTSKYEVRDHAKSVLLDKELLDARGEAKTLATDSYLFEEGRASRFGAVVVKGAPGSDEDEDAEFVDEQFAAREARKENEKNMKRRAQKLESNRDLYAEMAAARLATMRKDARHPKKSHSHSRPSAGSDESDEEQHEEDQSMVVEGDVNVEDVAELEEMNQRRSSRSRRSSKSHKKSFVSSSENTNSMNGGYASGEEEEEEEEEEEAPVPVEVVADVAEAESAEAEELRLLKKKYRAERRAKKHLIKEKEEEERTAVEAAELARAHREEQRAREEAKAREEQEKRDKKERREMKEKLKREKAKQRQAEAELRKLVELKQAEEERRERERKEKKEKKEKKKSKKKEKYTSPAERIHKKEERDAERAAEHAATAAAAAEAEAETEVSNALVVVETPVAPEPVQQPVAAPEPAQQPVAAPEPAPTPAPKSTPSPVQAEAIPAVELFAVPAAPVVGPAVVVAAAVAPASTPNSQGTAAQPHVMPMYQVVPPPFVPSYPAGPQSMPAYGLAATFGAYPPFYPAPYSYGAPVGPQPTYMRPNMGFVAGLSVRRTAGPEPAPSSQEEPMIGPQLPTPQERAAVSSSGTSAPPSPPPPPPSMGAKLTKLTNLPDLPDVVEF